MSLFTVPPSSTPSSAPTPPSSSQGAPPEPKGRRVKTASVLDPLDESEVVAPTSDQVSQWYAQYQLIKKGPPLPDKEPTVDQLAAMHARVIVGQMEPYADFSVLTPHGKRQAKRLRHRHWVMQSDGTFLPHDAPGPENFETWEKCFAVWEVIMLMIHFPPATEGGPNVPVLDLIALETYFENFRDIARENAEAWHLCCQAEDRCRGEHLPRVWRKLKEEKGVDPTWSQVLIYAAEDTRYWDKAV